MSVLTYIKRKKEIFKILGLVKTFLKLYLNGNSSEKLNVLKTHKDNTLLRDLAFDELSNADMDFIVKLLVKELSHQRTNSYTKELNDTIQKCTTLDAIGSKAYYTLNTGRSNPIRRSSRK